MQTEEITHLPHDAVYDSEFKYLTSETILLPTVILRSLYD